MDKIEEGNKIIAEFIGLHKIVLWGGVDFVYGIESLSPITVPVGSSGVNATISTQLLKAKPEQLVFHSSWDWLMPSIKKWDSLEGFIEGEQSDIYISLSDSLDNSIIRDYDILQAWKQLVKNINWYNTIK